MLGQTPAQVEKPQTFRLRSQRFTNCVWGLSRRCWEKALLHLLEEQKGMTGVCCLTPHADFWLDKEASLEFVELLEILAGKEDRRVV